MSESSGNNITFAFYMDVGERQRHRVLRLRLPTCSRSRIRLRNLCENTHGQGGQEIHKDASVTTRFAQYAVCRGYLVMVLLLWLYSCCVFPACRPDSILVVLQVINIIRRHFDAFVACAIVSTSSAPTLQGSHRTIDDEESRATPSAFPARTACAKRQAPMFRNGDEERQEERPVRPLPQSSAQ